MYFCAIRGLACWKLSDTGEDYMLLIWSSTSWRPAGAEVITNSVIWADLGPVADWTHWSMGYSALPLTISPGPPIPYVTVPTLWERFNGWGHGWELEHAKALGIAACLAMPPGAPNDLADLHAMATGQPLNPSGNADSPEGGAGGASIWIPNINTQKNGGQSVSASASGAATANAVDAATEYFGSALPCAAKQ